MKPCRRNCSDKIYVITGLVTNKEKTIECTKSTKNLFQYRFSKLQLKKIISTINATVQQTALPDFSSKKQFTKS